MVSGRLLGQCDALGKQCGDWFCVCDSARVEPWACGVHDDGAVRADGMRGDIVGVGYIGSMPCGAWCPGDATYMVDDRGAGREHDGGILNGRWLGQCDASGEQCGDWVGISDSARVEPWACSFHGDGAVRADWMRGDRVGVGDIDQVSCCAQCWPFSRGSFYSNGFRGICIACLFV